MTVRVGINGFGRIGRLALRVMAEDKNFECVGINDIVSAPTMAHLFKYDSVHGAFGGEVSSTENSITVNGKAISVWAEKDPSALPWKDKNCDVVLECTGKFADKEGASKHLSGGAKRVIISAPCKDKTGVPTFVFGVNHENFKPADTIVSAASCTTNCLAPIAKVINDAFGMERGFMTTIHSYTNDQRVVDGPHKDLRRARAAAVSQIPTTTGAAKAVGLVIPELAGKLDGLAIRVPTANVSLVDLVAIVAKPVTAEEVNAELKKASEGSLKGVLRYCEEPLVSVDFMGEPHPSVADAPLTRANGNMVKTFSWYDNEMGFTRQMMKLAAYIGSK
ncbi:MAG TPA: type I glyceraldehyde-3-phosphate dehydrogenase [bacterium]|nr:type I glyceraldehyde-3-phosphate dehydrogenase [bacterium]